MEDEEFRIELSEAVYHGEVPEDVAKQFDKSYGNRGWKIVAVGVIAVTLAGGEYFRRKHGEDD